MKTRMSWLVVVAVGAGLVAAVARAGTIPCGGVGKHITVDNGIVFVTPQTTADDETAASNSPVIDSVTGVTVQLGGYWTSWQNSVVYGYTYGDIGSIIAVHYLHANSTMTFTAPPGYNVTLVSLDAIGTIEDHGYTDRLSLSLATTGPVTSQSFTNVDLLQPEHNTLMPSGVTGSTITLTFWNGNTDYGSEGLNNIVFSVSPVPEPASLALFAFGVLALCRRARRQVG